jgi:hypothetical protein
MVYDASLERLNRGRELDGKFLVDHVVWSALNGPLAVRELTALSSNNSTLEPHTKHP